MDEDQLRKFVMALQADLQRLEAEDALGRDGQKAVRLDQQSVGRLSRMDALQQQAMSKATGARRAQSRQRILKALARIDAGEFGYCTNCSEDIPLNRLELDPTVPTCVSCARG